MGAAQDWNLRDKSREAILTQAKWIKLDLGETPGMVQRQNVETQHRSQGHCIKYMSWLQQYLTQWCLKLKTKLKKHWHNRACQMSYIIEKPG